MAHELITGGALPITNLLPDFTRGNAGGKVAINISLLDKKGGESVKTLPHSILNQS
jgi:hypothetical protein